MCRPCVMLRQRYRQAARKSRPRAAMVDRSLLQRATAVLLLAVLATAPAGAVPKLYPSITQVDFFPCVRLFNRTGSIGCSSGRAGATAALYRVETAADLLELEGAADVAPRALVVNQAALNVTMASRLVKEGHVASILVVPTDEATPLSPSTKTLGTSHEWNPAGTGWAAQRYRFPIVALSSRDAPTVLSAAAYNREHGLRAGRLHAARVTLYMGPDDMDSARCLPPGHCAPLGGQSVWASVAPLQQGDSRPVLLVTAPMDASALFHDLAVGARSTASTLAVLLAAAASYAEAALGADTGAMEVVFAALQGEAWGALGTRKLWRDVQEFECTNRVPGNVSALGRDVCLSPAVTPDLEFLRLRGRVTHVLSLDQLGVAADAWPGADLFVHETTASASAVGHTLLAAAADAGLTGARSDLRVLPPSAAATLHAEAQGVATTVLAGYNTRFGFNQYHSMTDVLDAVNETLLARTAGAVATALLRLSTGRTNATATANATLVRALSECLLTQGMQRCPLSTAVLPSRARQRASWSLYTSVLSLGRIPYVTGGGGGAAARTERQWKSGSTRLVASYLPTELFVRNVLASTIGQARGTHGACNSTSPCDAPQLCVAGECVDATAHFHVAIDTALAVRAGGSFAVSAEAREAGRPVWTEPYWGDPIGPPLEVELFLIDYTDEGAWMLAAGLAVAAGAAVLANWLHKVLPGGPQKLRID